jgi:vancomycin resistance protein YoaR
MSRTARIALIAAAVPIAVALWASVVFAMDRASNGGEVLGPVTVADVDVSGLDRDEALGQLLLLENRLATTPIPVDVHGTWFELIPSDVGYDLDEEAMLDAAMANGREGALPSQFGWWLGQLGTGDRRVVPPAADYDRDALEALLAEWENEAIDDPPFEGGILVEENRVLPEYPRTGTGIDVAAAVAVVEPMLLGLDRDPVTIPTEVRRPEMTDAAVDAAAEEGNRLIAGPVVLSRAVPSVNLQFPTSVLASALRSRPVPAAGAPALDVYFDPEPFQSFLDPLRAEIEVPPVNAQFVVRADETIAIIPSQKGTVVDDDAVTAAITAAARSAGRTGVFPFTEGAEPPFTTEAAESLGITTMLYRSVTFYPPGGDETNQNRIHNIHLIADAVDGAIVMPGEVFSLNQHVGQRTEEKGYKRAGAIIGEEVVCCDDPANVGGGVSQFTTTLYNAVFFAGLEDVEHMPHTLYFSRYPEGREATLGWPFPDLKFRNDTAHAVLIDTEHGPDSVTVRLYGDNGGRVVEADLSERRNLTEPKTKYEPNPDVQPGEERVVEEGAQGWTVTVFRTITFPDGTVKEQQWDWTYDPFLRVVEIHPCEYQGYPCPVLVPNVGGMTVADATAALEAAGVFIAIGEPFLVVDPALVGTVRSQDPPPGVYADAESTVTVRVGELDPSTTTTTTTTTSTTTTVP